MLVSGIGYAQETTIHFYYGTEKMLGSEVMFHLKGTESTYIGGGFSGALEQDRTVRPIADDEKWCSIYGVTSFGYFQSLLIKGKAGLAVYTGKNSFKEVLYKPLLGVGIMYPLTEDVGLEAGFDTFNYGTIGVTILF